MAVWDGNKQDTTNFATDKYLQINSCGFQNTMSDYTVIRKKGRRDYHILLINSGICEVLHKGNVYTLTKGDLVIYTPDEEQKYSFTTESSSLWCHFGGTIVKELLDSCNITSGVYRLTPVKGILDAYTSLIQRFNHPGRQSLANASLLELIYNISDAISYGEERDNSAVILPILTYINANYNKQITLDRLAKMSGYSKSRFSHIFSESVKTTPIKYQNEIRLKNACEMLISTGLSVSEISHICGFGDPLYFSRIFKRRYNISPTQYRQFKGM